MIIVKENFISKNQCDDLINFYNENIEDSFQFGNTFPLNTEKFFNVTDKIESLCYDLDKNIILDTHQIVKWPEESYMDFHKDFSDDIFAAIIYLNDDYEGGETVIEDVKVKPEVGKLLLFTSSKLLHSVNKITRGIRYTLALWFINS